MKTYFCNSSRAGIGIGGACGVQPRRPRSRRRSRNGASGRRTPRRRDYPNYQYGDIIENDFVSAAEEQSSYFFAGQKTPPPILSMRRQIEEGLQINKNSVRIEEYVNYFSYDYARPQQGEALALSAKLFDSPWSDNKLFTIGVAAEEITFENPVTNNVVFLIDTSGSMYGDDRLGLIQQAFTMLLENLNDGDYVSIVTYAGDCRVALNGARRYGKNQDCQRLAGLGSGRAPPTAKGAYSLPISRQPSTL